MPKQLISPQNSILPCPEPAAVKTATWSLEGVIIDSDVGPVDILPQDNKPVVVKVVPVKVGLIIGTLSFNAVCIANDIGLFKSEVLSTLPQPLTYLYLKHSL